MAVTNTKKGQKNAPKSITRSSNKIESVAGLMIQTGNKLSYADFKKAAYLAIDKAAQKAIIT